MLLPCPKPRPSSAGDGDSWWEGAQAPLGVSPKASKQQEGPMRAGKGKVMLKAVGTSFPHQGVSRAHSCAIYCSGEVMARAGAWCSAANLQRLQRAGPGPVTSAVEKAKVCSEDGAAKQGAALEMWWQRQSDTRSCSPHTAGFKSNNGKEIAKPAAQIL